MLEKVFFATAVVIFLVELYFFGYSFRWMRNIKAERDKHFEYIDFEKNKLLEFQASVEETLKKAHSLSSDTYKKISSLAVELEDEWENIQSKLPELIQELEERSIGIMESQITKVRREQLQLEKNIQTSKEFHNELAALYNKTKKLLKLLEGDAKPESILQDLKNNTYSEARKLILNGENASDVSKKLGISLSEVALISHTLNH